MQRLPHTYVLPNTDCGLLAVVMSKWDDIVGPKTVGVWYQEKSQQTTASSDVLSANENEMESNFRQKRDWGNSEILCQKLNGSRHQCDPGIAENVITEVESLDSGLVSAIKYITNHTVNCLSETNESETDSGHLHENGTSFFAVPDVNLVFLSLMFLIKEEYGKNTTSPYSIALVANYENYQYFMELRGLCLQWLRRIAFRYQTLQSQNSSAAGPEFWKNLNEWILDFYNMLVDVKHSALVTSPIKMTSNVVQSGIMKRALTSHLQTFGSSVVIGATANEINEVISFLSLFQDETDKYSSCIVKPPKKPSYHMGLKLQGLLLDEYGGRDLASLELMSNPIPVTVIDLTLGDSIGAVRQTADFKSYLVNPQQMYRHEYRYLNQESGSSLDHESVMKNVREAGKLVTYAINDLKCLDVKEYEGYVKIYLRRLNRLAMSLISIVSWMRNTRIDKVTFPGETNGGVTLGKHLKNSLKVEDADLAIILSVAEKLNPGIFVYVMERSG